MLCRCGLVYGNVHNVNVEDSIVTKTRRGDRGLDIVPALEKGNAGANKGSFSICFLGGERKQNAVPGIPNKPVRVAS